MNEAKVVSVGIGVEDEMSQFWKFIRPLVEKKKEVVEKRVVTELFEIFKLLEKKSVGDRFESRCEMGDQALYAIEPYRKDIPDEHFRNDEREYIFSKRIFQQTKIEHLNIGCWCIGPDEVSCQVPFETFIDCVVFSDHSTLKFLLYLFGYIDDSQAFKEKYPGFDVESFRKSKFELVIYAKYLREKCGYLIYVHS